MNKLLKTFLLSVICVAFMVVSVFAADIVSEGFCDENLTWTLDAEGTLTISGTGRMNTFFEMGTDGSWGVLQPWCEDLNNIKAVVIEDGVTSIDGAAFGFCENLTSVTIPDSVTSIGDYAFIFCESLESIIIPSSVRSIGYEAIPWNTTIYYDGTYEEFSQVFEQVDEYEVIYNLSGTCGENLTWEYKSYGVLVISGNGAMDNYCDEEGNYIQECPWASYEFYDMKQVVIKDGVTSIGIGAFSYCENLTSVIIPNSVISIGDYAFSTCGGLTDLTLSEGIISIGEYAFSGCTSLTGITLPSSIKSIGDYAFYGCDVLTGIIVPNSVEYVGYGVVSGGSTIVYFKGTYEQFDNICQDTEREYTVVCQESGTCGENLTWNFTFDGTFTISGTGAMEDYYDGAGNYTERPWENIVSGIQSVVIENGVTSIGSMAFADCENLTSVTISQSVKSVGYSAFAWCKALERITIPDGVTSLGAQAFWSCEGLVSVTIPGSVTSLGVSVFDFSPATIYYTGNTADWKRIEGYDNIYHNVVCSDSPVWSVENGTLTISGNADILNYYCYYDENNSEYDEDYRPWKDYRCDIYNIVIEEGITSIGAYAFAYFDNLTSVTIPESVTSIGNNAFYNSESLTDIYINVTREQWNNINHDSNGLLDTSLHLKAAVYLEHQVTYETYEITIEADSVSETADIYAASYSSDGRMLEIKAVAMTDGVGTTSFGKQEVSIVKAFALSSDGKLKPLGLSAILRV